MDFSILTTECVVRMAQALLISRVSLMVGRLAGRLVISGGRITTGTTPEAMEEEVACGGMRGACGGACEENNVDLWEHVGTWGTCAEHVGYMWGDSDANPDSVAAIHSPT